jgi:processive 1,2-diacylglycerol beta-glucosyltransferase
MRPQAHTEILHGSKRHEYLVEKLHLEPDRSTVFLATGGNGANNHLALLEEFLPHADRLQAIVICGRNRESYNEVTHWRAAHPQLACFVDGFSEDVHLLMQVSDAIVTRGGTTTCAKALHFSCPIIFNAMGGIMPQEELTVKFFRNAGAAELIASGADFAAVIDRWMADRRSYERLRRSFLALRYEEDPRHVIEELVDLAQEVSGTRLRARPFPPQVRHQH